MKQKCYTKYRIRPLKTPRQVRRYMRRQAWWHSFKELVWTERDRPLWQRVRRLLGYELGMTIEGAFDWDRTVQGYTHWSVINECFIAWFVNEYPQFKYRSK